jgi:hypothetical protein
MCLLTVRTKGPSTDPLNQETSTASSSTKRGKLLDKFCKPEQIGSSALCQPVKISMLCSYLPPSHTYTLMWSGMNPRLGHTTSRDTKQVAWWGSGNQPRPQAIKIAEVNSCFQYTKKGSPYGERSPEVNNQPSYKRLQLVYLDLSNVGNQVQSPEHMGKCLATS